MAVTPLLLGYLTALKTAIAAMSTPTYNQAIGTVIAAPIDATTHGNVPRPVVGVYQVRGDQSDLTLSSKLRRVSVMLDVLVDQGDTYDETWERVIKVISDLMILIEQGGNSVFGDDYQQIDSVALDSASHGGEDVGGALYHGRLAMTLQYRRPRTGGL